ncbi:hypothetical protein Tco_0824002 [Tanacetum coccineum]|uniref:Uncharacterized protein n=1 Tax=Tanacetum coccineum TaxID=301880 RepID=A0ABQ5ANM5_9ASTR
MVAYLEKTKGSEGFHQIIDFLTASHINYALTESPTIYASLIEQFWKTAALSTIKDGVMEIIATIDGRVKTITEEYIRRHLKLEDSDGISTLPTAEIFKQLALIGFIQIFLNKHQRLLLPHKRTYPTPTLTQKLFSNMKRASKGYSGVNTPLFQTMLVQDQGEGPTIPVVSHHTPTSGPSTSQPPSTPPSIQTTPVAEEAAPMPHDSPLPRVHSLGSDEGSLSLNELMVLCTSLSKKVESLESELKQTKQTYSTALTKLIKRVKKLEQTIKTSQARRRAKVVISDAEEDEEDPSKQGRSLIEELDMDAGISLVPPHVADQGRFDDTQVSDQPEEQLGVFSAAKVLADAAEQRRDVENVQTYTRRRRAVSTGSGGVSTASELVSTAGVKAKDKGKAVMQESEPPKKIKKRVQVQMSIDEELAQKVHEEEQARFNAEQEAKFKAEQEQERLDHETAMKIQEELDAAERQRMAQVHQAAQGFTDDEWDDILARVATDKDFVKQLQAGEKVSDEDLPRKLVELLEVQRLKRAGQDVVEEPAKRQRTGEASGSVQEQTGKEPKAEEPSQEQLHQMIMMVIPVEEVYVEALQNFVKERFITTEPTEDKVKELWVELKRLFEPDDNDTLYDVVPTNMALMAFSDSEFNLATYKRGLASVEEQLVFSTKRTRELEKTKQEKEIIQLKIENFDNASKILDKLIGSQITDNSRKGVGFVSYNVVPPPHTGLFSPPKVNLSNSGLEEFQQPEFEGYGSKTSKNVSEEKKTVSPTTIEFVRPKQQEKPVRKPIKYAEMYRPKAVNTARPNSAVVNVVSLSTQCNFKVIDDIDKSTTFNHVGFLGFYNYVHCGIQSVCRLIRHGVTRGRGTTHDARGPTYVCGSYFQAPQSLDYVPGPEEPEQEPPSPVYLPYVPEPVYPEYMPPKDDVLPAEEQPLPAATSPTTKSPRYIPESDLEEDDEKDPEEDPADYPADRGDDRDDEESSDDDDDEEEDEEDEDEEEKEHLALADPTVVAFPIDQGLFDKETESFKTDESMATPPSPPHPTYRVTARMSIQTQALALFLFEEDAESPTYIEAPLGFRAAGIRQRDTPPSLVHETKIPKIFLLLHKRPCRTAPTPRYEVGESSAAGAARQDGPAVARAELYGFVDMVDASPGCLMYSKLGYGIMDTWDDLEDGIMYSLLEDAREDRYLLRGQVNMLFRDRPYHRRTALLMEEEARVSRVAWVQLMDASDKAQMTDFQRHQGPANGPAQPEVPEEAGSSS